MLIPNFGKTWMIFIFYNSIYYWARRNNRDRLTKAISKLAMFSFETTLTKNSLKISQIFLSSNTIVSFFD